MTKEEIKAVRIALGRTQAAMGRLVGTSGTTWYRWEKGTKPLPVYLDKIKKLRDWVAKHRGE